MRPRVRRSWRGSSWTWRRPRRSSPPRSFWPRPSRTSSGRWRTGPPSFAPQSTAYSKQALPSIALLAPVLLPLFAAGAITAFGLGGFNLGRIAVGGGVWAAAVALLVLWLPLRSTQELTLGQLGFGSPFQLRIDAVGFAFGLMVLLPAALVLTLQRRNWQEAALGALGVAAAMGTIEAGGVVLTALAGSPAGTLAVIQLDGEDARAPRPRWSMLLAAWLALRWAGALLQVRRGTAPHLAVPVSALTTPAF